MANAPNLGRQQLLVQPGWVQGGYRAASCAHLRLSARLLRFIARRLCLNERRLRLCRLRHRLFRRLRLCAHFLTRLLRLQLCLHARLQLARLLLDVLIAILITIARLCLPLTLARLEGALDLLRLGQRRPERHATVRVRDALQPREVATLVRHEARVVLIQKVDELAQGLSAHRVGLLLSSSLVEHLLHHAKALDRALLLEQADRLARARDPRLRQLRHGVADHPRDARGAIQDRHGVQPDLHHWQQLVHDLRRLRDLDRVAIGTHRQTRQFVDEVEIHGLARHQVAKPLLDRLEGVADVAICKL
eukprot:scaffold534_cov63-Phaeocystis_antarctica.AAC.1